MSFVDIPLLSNYKIKKILGKGTFSTVKLATDIQTGEKIAIKILEKNKIRCNRDFKRIEREISMVKNINHVNIAHVFDIKEDKDRYYIMMEYCEKGELFNLILDKHKLSEEEASYFYFQIINGLEYIHKNNIIHRDLKPENLLLDKNNILKIIDFGLSNYNTYDNLLSTPCGSPCYASPEMVSGEKYNGFTSDVWSTGIILYAMIYGYLPFENLNNNNDLLFQKISECKVDYPRNSCIFALDLLKKILVPDPNERITIKEIKNHKLYLKGKNIFQHKHKGLDIYENYDIKRTSNINNIRDGNSKEKYDKSEKNINGAIELQNDYDFNNEKNVNNSKDKENSHKRREVFNSENILNGNRKIENRSNQNDLINSHVISAKQTTNSFHNYHNEEKNQRLSNIEDNYFSRMKANEYNKRNTYFNNDLTINNEIKNNIGINKNLGLTRKTNFVLAPHLAINKTNNYDSINFKGEEGRKNKAKMPKKNKHNYIIKNNYSTKNNKIVDISNLIQDQTSGNKNKTIKLDFLVARPMKTSDSKSRKRIEFPRYLNTNNIDRNSFSIENGNGYYYQAFTNLKKISPLNIHNNRIVIDIEKESEKQKKNKTILQIKDKLIDNGDEIKEANLNSDNNIYIKNDDINLYQRNKRTKRGNDLISYEKKYSSSVQKINIGEKNKNNSLIRSNTNKNSSYSKESKISKEELKKDINKRKVFATKSIHNKNKNNAFDNFFKFNTNSKMKEIKPISIINYKPNNSFLINTPSPNRRELNFTFLNKNRLNRKKYKNTNNSINVKIESNSFNNDINQHDKNFSFLNTNKSNEINTLSNNDSIDKSENLAEKNFENNDLIYSNIYKIKYINNKSLGEKYFRSKNTFNNKENKSKDNNDKNRDINNRKSEMKKRIKDNYNNNYIKIITDSRKDLNDIKIQNKSSTSALYDSLPLNLPHETIIKYKRKKQNQNFEIKNNFEDEKLFEEELSEKKEGNENFKERKRKLRLLTNNINKNYLNDEYLDKANLNKEYEQNNINNTHQLIYNMETKAKDLFKTDRNERKNNHETYTYAHKNMNENFSNKCLAHKKLPNNYKLKLLNRDKKNMKYHNPNEIKEVYDEKQNNIKGISANNIINNIGKINISNLPSITIDMNVLNKNNMKYLKFYDAIKNKL